MTWHLDPEAVARYAAGSTPPVEAASAEAHLLRCADCRAALAAYTDRPRLDAVFANVTDALDAPRPGPLERLLRSAGIRADTARVLVATPALRTSWLLAVLGALAFAVAAAYQGPDGRDLFLAVAPVLPVLGVALAYGAPVDPLYEIAVAAPFGGFRLLLLRTVAVVSTTTGLTLAAGLLLPGAGVAAAWLLPALALTALTLAAGPVWGPQRCAAAVVATWLVVAGTALRWDADVTGPRAQVACAVLLALGIATVAGRRDSYEQEAPA